MIETEFGQGVTGKTKPPGKSEENDSIQGEKLGEKESSAQKPGDAGGEEMGRKKDGEEVGFPGL